MKISRLVSITPLITTLFLVLIEIGSYVQFKKYSLFYQTPQIDELNHRLFKVLDPVLGYAADPFFVPNGDDAKSGYFSPKERTANAKDGFVILDGVTSEPPIKIVILGESTTDPYLFGGNWPWALHEILLKKNISHKIFNGAVSGYTSTQQLVKIIRDVLHMEKPDIVIAYNGLADTPEIDDTVPNHVGVHVYQKYLADTLSGNLREGRDPIYLPNLQYGLNYFYVKYFARVPSFVQYGVTNSDNLSTFITNTKAMNAICNVNGIKFYHFLSHFQHQDSQADLKHPLAGESPLSDKDRNGIINFLKKSEQLLQGESYSKSYADILPHDEQVFVDEGHTNEHGSQLIAEKMFQDIKWK